MALRKLQRVMQKYITSLMLFHLFVVHIYQPMKKTYESRYNSPPSTDTARPERSSVDANVVVVPFADAVCERSTKWKWAGLPKVNKYLSLFRSASTICMCYVMIKALIPNSVTRILDIVNLDLPAHCYLIGRFVFQPEVERIAGFLFVSYHLGWRFVQLYLANPIYTSGIYFMLLEDEDVDRYINFFHKPERNHNECHRSHSQHVTSSGRPTASVSYYEHSKRQKQSRATIWNPHDQFMHEVMSFKIDYGTTIEYKLRPSRTIEARRKLRNFLVNSTAAAISVFVFLATILTYFIFKHLLHVETYLKSYEGCSPELARLVDAKRTSSEWSMKFITLHQYIALVADIEENVFIWTESGVVAVFDLSLTMLLIYDLHLYWTHLDRRTDELLTIVKLDYEQAHWPADQATRQRPKSMMSYDQSSSQQNPPSPPMASRIFELQSQIQDLIKQIDQVNKFVSDSYSVVSTMWFTIFAFYTYKLFSNSVGAVVSILVGIMLIFLICSGTIILTIQRDLKRSYPKICSLMAHDRSMYKQNFVKIIEYFVNDRHCFTIFRIYTMKSTTLLTMIGYSFSCFFIVGSMYKR
jgi:hypothetical protein